MKQIKYILVLLVLTIAFQSCDFMGSLDRIQPENVLTDGSGDVIIDESTATMTLNGVYASIRRKEIADMRRALGGLSHSLAGAQSVSNYTEFLSGKITENNYTLEDAYVAYYNVINQANSFINNMEIANLTESVLSTEKKEEMIGEARCIRALFHLNLFCLFAQYNDMNSTYGIVINEAPVTSNDAKARSTVKESFTSIINDLEYAGTHCSATADHWKVSSVFAKALEARCYLLVGDNANAAAKAQEAIDASAANGYTLESNYIDGCTKMFNSSEMLFAPYTSASSSPQQRFLYTALHYFQPHDLLTSMAGSVSTGETDSRYTAEYEDANTYGNNKYVFPSDGWNDENTFYFMRLPEVYYIKAEAEARLGNYDAARTALLPPLERAGYSSDYVNGIANDKLLEMTLKHKILELNAETGNEWFDLVRYHRNGDFKTWSEDEQALLPTFDFCIFPIPRTARGGNNLLEQTPSFD
jgi:hypothetical protein